MICCYLGERVETYSDNRFKTLTLEEKVSNASKSDPGKKSYSDLDSAGIRLSDWSQWPKVCFSSNETTSSISSSSTDPS